MHSFHISPLGDQALTIQLGKSIEETINQQCISLAEHIRQGSIAGVKDIIPAYNTISVMYDGVQVSKTHHTNKPSAFLLKELNGLIQNHSAAMEVKGRNITLPACFHHTMAPDLEILEEKTRKSTDAIIQQFIQTSYRVYMLGFLPGFAYMGKVDDELALPRKEKPHLKIPAGSIGIAGNQTGIYPLDSPGGWNIIGRTPLLMFNAELEEPCLLKPGDMVTFKAISIDEFHSLNQNH